MLVEAVNEVRESGGDTRTLRLYGQEVNLTTAAIARMNLYMHDIEDFRIVRGDTLRDPKFHDDKGQLAGFDVVIANPPFSLKNWGAEVWVADPWKRPIHGIPPQANGDYAFVQHMIASMNERSGRVGVVMPNGALFRTAESEIRAGLLSSDLLEAVVGLPQNMFYSTAIPACLLIFRAVKAESRKQRVLFIDGSRRFAKTRTRNDMSRSDIEAIVTCYKAGVSAPNGSVDTKSVPLSEIKENGWDLSLGRYLHSATADTGDVGTELAALRQAREALNEAEREMDKRLKAAGYE
jgi:type I restriction enzyme M protein